MDVHPKERKPRAIGQLPEERALLKRIIGNGLVDTSRALEPDNDQMFTWWAPWRNMRERNIGWRLDYVLASQPRLRPRRSLRRPAGIRHERSRARDRDFRCLNGIGGCHEARACFRLVPGRAAGPLRFSPRFPAIRRRRPSRMRAANASCALLVASGAATKDTYLELARLATLQNRIDDVDRRPCVRPRRSSPPSAEVAAPVRHAPAGTTRDGPGLDPATQLAYIREGHCRRG